MIFSVKIRQLPDGDWMIHNGITADSFGSAERYVKRLVSKTTGVPESQFDVRSYRTDTKSVFHKGLK